MILLSEELALLAFDEDRGVTYDRAGSALPHALGATLILDLQTAGCVELGEDTEVVAVGSAPADPLLAEAWHAIQDDSRVRKFRAWVDKPTRLVKHLPTPVYEHLAERGVLDHTGKSAILRRDRYRELDERPGQDLIGGLASVLDGERDPTPDEVLLLALVPVARLTTAVFPDRDRRTTEARIEALVAGDDEAGDIARRVARAAAAGVAAAAVAGGAFA